MKESQPRGAPTRDSQSVLPVSLISRFGRNAHVARSRRERGRYPVFSE